MFNRITAFFIGGYMNISLYKTLDGDNVINKTLTSMGTVAVNLKRETDVITPLLVLTRNATIDYESCNYLFISVFSRYYFIRDVSILNSKLVMLRCEVDYVETYKTDILNSECRFMRNIKTGDYLNTSIEHSFLTTVSLHNSNKGFEGSPTMILTTIGG